MKRFFKKMQAKASLKEASLSQILGFVLRPFRSWYRKSYFRFCAFYEGGTVRVGKNVIFNQKVIFQGKGTVLIGSNVIIGYRMAGEVKKPILFQARSKESIIKIADFTQIMNGCEVLARQSIEIGERVLIGAGTKITDSDFHQIDPTKRNQEDNPKSVLIGANVWLGWDCLILKGSIIQENCVVGARSVVCTYLEKDFVYAGIPAQKVRSVNN